MFTFTAIGFVRSPYTDTAQIPKGRGAEHHAEGVLDILPEYEQGLADIEGFSHLYVLWAFDRSLKGIRFGFWVLGFPFFVVVPGYALLVKNDRRRTQNPHA